MFGLTFNVGSMTINFRGVLEVNASHKNNKKRKQKIKIEQNAS